MSKKKNGDKSKFSENNPNQSQSRTDAHADTTDAHLDTSDANAATTTNLPTEAKTQNIVQNDKDSKPMSEPMSDKAKTSYTSPEPESFGTWLKAQRLERNISLEEIAAVTKVHIHQLEIIEEDKWSELPAPAFVRGFLVCYARHLELDEEEILKRFKSSMGPGFKTIEAVLPDGLSGVKSATRPNVRVASSPNFQKAPGAKNMDVKTTPLLSPKKLGLFFGAVLIVAFIVTLISVGKEEQSQEQAQQNSELAPAVEPQPAADVEPSPSTDAVAAEEKATKPPQNELIVYGIENTWIKAKIDDENSKGTSLAKGKNQKYFVHDKVRLVLSNAGAVEIKWNGIHYASPGFRGDVKTLTLPQDLSSLEKKKWPPKPVATPKPDTSNLPGASPANLPGTETN
ncbi:hypothetical protein GW916_02600 [bacterium]|nr:hypothetical protein [bacterium]